MYQALYRKWRPKTFDDVVGQEHITETLKKQVMNDRLSHAYLFIGTRGTGKTTCAKILAKAVNCEHPVNGNPCGECPSCRAIEEESTMDIVEMDAASNNGVDNIRALREDAIFSPTSVRKRVYIVDEVHMLSIGAFNALLKILEEPPEHLMFILATTELNKVPATILSRCQRYSFKRISVPQIRDRLNYVASQEPFELDTDAAEFIAQLSDGGMRDALSLLDQCSGTDHITVETVYSAMGLAGNLAISQMMDHILSHNAEEAVKLFHQMWKDGKDPSSMLNEINSLLRDVLITKIAPSGGNDLLSGTYAKDTLARFSGVMSLAELTSRMNIIQDALGAMRSSVNSRIDAELCLVRLCQPELSSGADALESRIDRLEKMLAGKIPAPAPAVRAAPAPAAAAPVPAPAPAPTPRPVPEPQMPDGSPLPEEPPMEDAEPYLPEIPEAPVKSEPPAPAAAAEPVPVPLEDPNSPGGSVSTEDPAFIEQLKDNLHEILSSGLKHFMRDPSITFVLKANILNLYIPDNFKYSMLNKQEVINTFRQEAYKLSGREINVVMHDKAYDHAAQSSTKDVHNLDRFKEVHFTGGNNNG